MVDVRQKPHFFVDAKNWNCKTKQDIIKVSLVRERINYRQLCPLSISILLQIMTYWIVPKTSCFLLLIKINSNHLTTRSFLLTVDLRTGQVYFWACLHGGGIPGGWGNPLRYNLSILRWSRLRDRWGNPPHVTSPTWGPPHSCKQALRKGSLAPHDSSPTEKSPWRVQI